MEIERMIQTIKEHPAAHRMGMILCHVGIVRGSSRKGGEVEAVEAAFDSEAVDRIVNQIKEMEGVVEVLVHVNEGRLAIGDEIMLVAVGGDIREHVFPALETAVNRLKAEASRKREIFT